MASTKQVELRIPCCHFPTFLGQLSLADAASPVEAKGIGVCPSGLIISSTRAAIQSLTKRGSLLASHVGVSCPATAKHGGRPKARQIMSVKRVGRGCGLHVPVRVPRSETMLATEPENAYLVMLPDSAHKSQTVWGWHGLRSSRIGAERGASACCGWYVQEWANLRRLLHLVRWHFCHARGRTQGSQRRHTELGTNKKGP